MEFRKEIGESLTLKFAESANQRRLAGKDIISLGLGEPDFEVPHELISSTITFVEEHCTC
jgi:aspartate/methionine/tyrosine aminotransferase